VGKRQGHNLEFLVVVPVVPGPVTQLEELGPRRDDLDDVLDEMFGEPDDRGPGAADAVLVVGGMAAVIAGLVMALPVAVTVAGVAAAGLGLILPARSLWNRVVSARREARIQAVERQGILLRTDHPTIRRLLAAYTHVSSESEQMGATIHDRAVAVAHGAVVEAATLLNGHRLTDPSEEEYIVARSEAIEELASALKDGSAGRGERDRRRALLEARLEVEQLAGGTSISDVSDLVDELRSFDGA
jgi:hypothetical protein